MFQDSGTSGRKRRASTSLTDDEGLSPMLLAVCGCSETTGAITLGAARAHPAWRAPASPVAQGLVWLGAGTLVDGGVLH